ncbi:MAG: VOC family protein [Bosea sp. (in: a-proteobacteria)]
MARLIEQANVLISKDVPAAIAYWTTKVGFEVTGAWGEPVEFAILKRDGVRIMLGAANPDVVIVPYWQQRDQLWNAYFWVDDAAALFAEMKASGARIDYELCDKPYGVREFGLQDLDGHDIGFGQVIN